MEEQALAILKIAVSDLKVSNLLFDNKQYPQSVFYLQQSVEKAFKAFWSWTGISYNEILNTGHNNFKIMKTQSKSISNGLGNLLSNYDLNSQIINNEIININKIEYIKKSYDSIYGYLASLNDFDLINLSLDDIIFVIDSLDNIKILSNDIINLPENKFKETMRSILFSIEPLSLNDFEDFHYQLTNNLLQFALKSHFCYMSLFYLSLVTFQHVTKSRYIDEVENFNPSVFYNSNLPLIVKYPEIILKVEQTISVCNELFITKPPFN